MHHVFLLGDSIRMGRNDGLPGYEPALRALTAGAWEIHSPAENCRFAQYALRYAHQWAAACDREAVALVVFNAGLWDVLRILGDEPLTPPEVYRLMLARLTRRLQALFPHARLLFLTSTPTLEARYTGDSCRKNSDIRHYNAIARQVMEENGLAVLDLFALAEKFPEDYFADHVHFAAAGSKALAEAIYEAGQALINKEE